MERHLQRIANTLVLYSYHVNNNGLLIGKMGIILFLYRYSQFINNKYYSDFAGNMLDEVLKGSRTVSNDFESGLTGIGWTVNYLLKKEILEGNANNVLRDVDKKVFNRIICDPETSVFGHAIYLLERLKDNKNDVYFEKQIENILDICRGGLQKYKGKISLYHINSILYFLIEVDKIQKYTDKVTEIRNILTKTLEQIEEQNLFDSSDLIIFDQILANVEIEKKSKWNKIILKKPQSIESKDINSMEQYIRNAWLQQLYFDKVNLPIPFSDKIRDFIDEKQKSITINDFLFMQGLAGLGCALLSQRES